MRIRSVAGLDLRRAFRRQRHAPGTQTYGNHRRLIDFEPLEDRHLLSGVTLITHGFAGNVSGWVSAMAEAILTRPDLTIDQPRYVVEVTDPGHDNGPLSVLQTGYTGPSPVSPDTEFPEIVILLDWSDVAGGFAGGHYRSTADVAAAAAEALLTPNFLADLPAPVAELPLHLIGHSRGASLVGQLAHDLGRRGIWVEQVTTLDPHPVDGVREPLPLDFGDVPMTSWENVVFWDNYWRTEGDNSLDFTGETVANTYDVRLDEAILETGGYTFSIFPPSSGEHSDVHLWYYGTIDTSTDPPANNGDHDVPNDWYGGLHPLRIASGYNFSRVVGGARPDTGLSQDLGGGADRDEIDWSNAVWPSIIDLDIAAGELDFTIGESIPTTYYYQDVDSSATVTFYLDLDKNPYNGNELQTDQQPVSQTGTALIRASHDTPTDAAAEGAYYVGARISDNGGRSRHAYAPDAITLHLPAWSEIAARHVFYNNSGFDGGRPAANVLDDAAIAVDKQALMPGQTATFANYTSYSRGLNGIMIDIAGLQGTPTVADFRFRLGNGNRPGAWARAASPRSVTTRPGEGVGGSDRVTLIWPDGAIQKQWLQVTVLATENTALAEPDVFYFGNAIGESGNSTTDAKVNVYDMLTARDHPRTFLNPAPINFPDDYDRDARVNIYDLLVARDNQTSFLEALKLITVPENNAARGEALSMVIDQLAGFEHAAARPHQQAGRNKNAAAVDLLFFIKRAEGC